MDEAGEFINMMSCACCHEMNAVEINLEFYTPDDNEQEYKVIEDNMMRGKLFSQKKFSRFALDKLKRDDLKQALNDLENHGMDLKYCWEQTGIQYSDLSLKEKVIAFLITEDDINTFDDLFKAFEPNCININL